MVTPPHLGYFFGLITLNFTDHWGDWAWPTDMMRERGLLRVVWIGTLVAFPSGCAVAISLLSGNEASLVGVAISVSLLPPSVNAVSEETKEAQTPKKLIPLLSPGPPLGLRHPARPVRHRPDGPAVPVAVYKRHRLAATGPRPARQVQRRLQRQHGHRDAAPRPGQRPLQSGEHHQHLPRGAAAAQGRRYE